MKRLLLIAFAFLFVFTSCNNDKKFTTETKNPDGTTTKQTVNIDPEQMKETTDEMQKKMDELKKLTPLSTDQLKAALPADVMGWQRSNFNANSMMGYAFAEGEYKKDDTTDVKIAIYDCAGETGSAMYGLNYWSKMSFQQESSDGYTKTIDFNGQKAVESWNKNMNQSQLTYVANDRLLVTITGHNVKAEDLKAAAEKLNIKAG